MEDRQVELLSVLIVFVALSWITVALRCYGRIYISKVFGSDDVFIIITLLAFSATAGLGMAGIHFGIGRHNAELTLDNLINAAKYQILTTLAYIATTAILKISVGLLLLRLVDIKPFYKYLIWISVGVVSIWTLITFIIGLIQCRPLAAAWNPYIPGTCLPSDVVPNFGYAISAETIFFDWLFALLPIPVLWNIKMNNRLKISIALILSLGVVASIATIIRLKYIVALGELSDGLYSIAPVFLWSSVELGLGIIAASVATLRPILRRFHIIGFNSDEATESRSDNYANGYRKTESASIPPLSRQSDAGSSTTPMKPRPMTSGRESTMEREVYEMDDNLRMIPSTGKDEVRYSDAV
ncbi:integral membrane family protein [Rutstroemia sp. NJR-2017a WRK4]|nr:integral membrane family protein [Rutstroemia sp. NJR-2017a WRK4]